MKGIVEGLLFVIGDEGLSLALGGLGKGVSPTTMAMAYATIANDGTYISPTFYWSIYHHDIQV